LLALASLFLRLKVRTGNVLSNSTNLESSKIGAQDSVSGARLPWSPLATALDKFASPSAIADVD